jgi:hypothetical protein
MLSLPRLRAMRSRAFVRRSAKYAYEACQGKRKTHRCPRVSRGLERPEEVAARHRLAFRAVAPCEDRSRAPLVGQPLRKTARIRTRNRAKA